MNNQHHHKHFVKALKVALFGCCIAFGAAALAASLTVSLNGANETPPVKTAAMGSGTITVNADMTVSGTVKTTGLVGTVAHIHMGAEGKKGPVIITFVKSDDNNWSIPVGAMFTAAQYASYKAGNLYINVHSDANKDGEIRGQLKP